MNPRLVEVRLGDDHVGYLSEVGSIVRFAATDAYIGNPDRPTLSLCFTIPANHELSVAILSDPRNAVNVGEGRLPPYFANLLPEGVLKTLLAKKRHVDEDDDFEILAAAGNDLPGAVTIHPASPDALPTHARSRLIGNGAEGVAITSVEEPIEGAFSLAGVQEKLALSLIEKGRRYTLPTKSAGADIIAKLPSMLRPDMVRNEFASMTLARAAGVDTAEFWLEDMHALDVPGMEGHFPDGEPFLAVKRFDRTPQGRIHTEDLCQVLGRPPRLKYAKEAEYVKAVKLLDRLSPRGIDDIREFIRRQVVNTLIGNTDAHLKNFSFLYADRRLPTLSPAYDIVCIAAYLGEGDYLLNESIDRLLRQQTLQTYIDFARAAGIATRVVEMTVRQTVQKCREAWPPLLQELPFSERARHAIRQRLESLPLARA